MPPQSKISKDSLLQSASAIIREQGSNALNARSLAKKNGCSTQPIFSKFDSMEDVIGQVRELEFEGFKAHFSESMQGESNPLVGAGMAFMSYAVENPNMFSFLFLEKNSGEETGAPSVSFLKETLFSKDIITYVKNDSGLDEAYVKSVIGNFYYYLAGKAVTTVTLEENATEEELRQEFKDFYKAYRKMYKKKDKEA